MGRGGLCTASSEEGGVDGEGVWLASCAILALLPRMFCVVTGGVWP